VNDYLNQEDGKKHSVKKKLGNKNETKVDKKSKDIKISKSTDSKTYKKLMKDAENTNKVEDKN
jgi:hypothetical protein